MKVLLLASHFEIGGITSYVLSLAKGLIANGIEVGVASAPGRGIKQLGDIPFFDIGPRTKCEIGPRSVRSALKVSRIVREHGFDILHAQTRVASFISFWVSKSTGTPFISTAHGHYNSHLGRRLFPCWGKLVIAISQHVRQHLLYDFNLNEKYLRLIYNGTDLDRFPDKISAVEKKKIRINFGLDPDLPTLGIVARLSPVKGHEYFFKALARIKDNYDFQVVIVGEGPEKNSLQDLVSYLKLDDNVKFFGSMENTIPVLKAMDIFVLPSLQEGLSLSILEAQACGLPVVATNVGGISEIVENERTGILTQPRDDESLGEAIKRFLDDPDAARRMGWEGRVLVNKQFSLEEMVKKVISVYNEVLTG
ncbi:MAG: glycosyltransferase family 4 protein [Candidatus Theseobacter exili]|nr:glycosyltransferase family 4 protein [Candidatus Theseobacter exili]